MGTAPASNIAFGSATLFRASSSVSFVDAEALSSTAFVVSYTDGADSQHGTAKVGTVSGTDITFGAEAEFLSTGTGSWASNAKLSSTLFVVAYRDGTDLNRGKAKVGTVSGTDITFGAEAPLNTVGVTIYISTAALSATRFVVAYRDDGDLNHGKAEVGTVSGTDITFGALAEFLDTGAASQISAAALDATRFIVAYADGTDGNRGKTKLGTVSGTDITFGAEAAFQRTKFAPLGSEVVPSYTSVAALGGLKFVAGYNDGATPSTNRGSLEVGTMSADASLAGSGGAYDSAAAAVKVAFAGWLRNPSA